MAGFDLNSFIGENRDFARGYTFYASIPAMNQEFGKRLVKSTRLPASNTPVAEVNWQGNKYKIGTTQEFQEFTITYNVDPDDRIRFLFTNWMQEVHNPENNLHGDPMSYMRDLRLEHLSHRDGTPIMVYTLIYAWPSSVGELSLDYGTKEIAYFDVTFNYQWHEIE